VTLESEIRLWERVKMIAEANLKKYPEAETQNGPADENSQET
jgi:hypothetical protein